MLEKGITGTAARRLDPRVRRTRELIVRAFDELVAEKGHTGLTVQEIAGRATVNRATFYAHFRDQYELFDHYISEAFREELRSRLSPSAGLDRETLRDLVLAACFYLEGLNTACSRTDRQFRPVIEARVQGELYELLLGWIGELGVRETSSEVAASAASWTIFGAGLQWSRGTFAGSAEDVADAVLPMLVAGLEGAGIVPARTT